MNPDFNAFENYFEGKVKEIVVKCLILTMRSSEPVNHDEAKKLNILYRKFHKNVKTTANV